MTKRVAKPAAPHDEAKRQRRVLTRDPEWARAAIRKLRRVCHPKQLAAADDPSDLVSLLVARGGGKTVAAEVRLVTTMCRKPKARCLYVTKTKEHAAEICWEPLKELFTWLGIEYRHSEVKRTITLVANGSTLRLAGADDRKEVEKFRGPEYDGVVIDEAASWDPQILEWFIDRAVRPRQGGVDGWIMMIGNPGINLAGPFYEATRVGGEEHRPYDEREKEEFADWHGWSSHTWSLEYAAAFVPKIAKLWAKALETKKLKRWGDTNPIWKREYLGQWAADSQTMVFGAYQAYADDGKTQKNQWTPTWLPNCPYQFAALPDDVDDWHYVYIFDKGAGRRGDEKDKKKSKKQEAEGATTTRKGDPFAVNIYAFSPRDPLLRIFHVFAFEATQGMHARAFACLLLGARDDDPLKPCKLKAGRGLLGLTGWPDAIVGDTDQGFLDELQAVYGIPAAKADKKQDTKTTAIEEVNGDFTEERIFIIKESPLEKQLQGLQWKIDEYGIARENKAQANHSTDTLVYGRQAISKLFADGILIADPRHKPVKTIKGAKKPATSSRRPRVDADAEPDEAPVGGRDRGERPTVLGDFGEAWSGVVNAGTYDGW